MFASERFRRHINKVRKAYRTAPAEVLQDQVHHAFDLCLSSIPVLIRDDIFAYLMTSYSNRKADYPDLFAYADYLGDFIDLLNLEYDERRDPLFPEDWEYLRNTVSDFAAELDMKLVSYTMALIVEKGYLG